MEDSDDHKPIPWSYQDYAFTQFAHDVLSEKKISGALRHLQQDSGFNINVILYLLWIADARYGRLTKRNLKKIHTSIYPWHQRVITELKYTYALVADQDTTVARNIKKQLQEEIAKAHIIEQRMLYETKIKTNVLRRSPKQQLADACTSIIHYCELKNDLLVEEDQSAFSELLMHVFSKVDESEIEKQVRHLFERLQTPMHSSTQLMWETF